MDKQPNSKHCFVCGKENLNGLCMEFYEPESGYVVAHYTIPEWFQGYPGVAHGGIVASMLDEVAARTIMRGTPPERIVVTAQIRIRYRKPVPVNQPLRLEGILTKDRGFVAHADSKIFDSDGNLLAEADGVFTDVTQRLVDSEAISSDNWTVYPDEE